MIFHDDIEFFGSHTSVTQCHRKYYHGMSLNLRPNLELMTMSGSGLTCVGELLHKLLDRTAGGRSVEPIQVQRGNIG